MPDANQVGPFIDSMHSSFQDGLVEYDGMMLSFDDIFVFQGWFTAFVTKCLGRCTNLLTAATVMTLIDKVFASNSGLQVVLLPSLRDANHELVYPQPPFNKKKVCEAFGSPEYAKVRAGERARERPSPSPSLSPDLLACSLQRIHLMPNPCTFAINDVVIGVSALDVVVQLSSNELYRSQARDQNRLMRLCEQVIDQRRYASW